MANPQGKEQDRIDILHEYDIMDSQEEKEFDRLVQLAAEICEVPFGKINFLDEYRTWSKANYGNDIKETPREVSFCHQTIQHDSHLIIENTLENEIFSQLPFVVDRPKVRFYAGFNIRSKGYNLGTVCVMGTEPKALTEMQFNALSIIAGEIENRLELKKKNKDLVTLTAFLEASVEAMLIVDPADLEILKINSNGSDLLDRIITGGQGKQLLDVIPGSDFEEKLGKWDSNKPLKVDVKTTDQTGKRLFLKVNMISKYGKWLITFQDITEQKMAEANVIEEIKLSDAIINALPIDFYMFDESMNLIRWNETLKVNTNYSDDELSKMKLTDLFKGSDVDLIKEHIDNALKGDLELLEADLVTKEGKGIPFLFSAVSFKNNNKNYLLGTGQDISDQVDQQERLKKLIDEKEVLLQEVHHRVKNNLAIISGFLQLQEFVSDNERTRSVLRSNYRRVKSMSLIHEELYKAKDFSGIEFDHYLKLMLGDLKNSMENQSKAIELHIDADPVYMNLNQAVPLALIISELVSNAYTFAFEGKKHGAISVQFKEKNGVIHVSVKDNGNGLPDDFQFEQSPTLGTTIVMSYSKQLNAAVDIESGEGTEIYLSFDNRIDTTGTSFKVMI